jgi:hypothetical protein
VAKELNSQLNDVWAVFLRRSEKDSRHSLPCEKERKSRHGTRVLQAREKVRPGGRGLVGEGLTRVLANNPVGLTGVPTSLLKL